MHVTNNLFPFVRALWALPVDFTGLSGHRVGDGKTSAQTEKKVILMERRNAVLPAGCVQELIWFITPGERSVGIVAQSQRRPRIHIPEYQL